jgi:hypothetical protein
MGVRVQVVRPAHGELKPAGISGEGRMEERPKGTL